MLAGALQLLSHLILTATLRGWYDYPHFTHEDTKSNDAKQPASRNTEVVIRG